MGKQIFSISQITEKVSSLFKESFTDISVEGEVSGVSASSTGHYYFTLKDYETDDTLSAVIFKWLYQSIAFLPKQGDKVIVTGKISPYGKRSNYSITVQKVERSGEGELLAKLEELRKRMAAEGLFDESRKIPIPEYPRIVGVVTSPTGDAIHDIISNSHRRDSSVNIILFPAAVQGDLAATNIAAQIRCADRLGLCDVIIVGRGGGSFEDLLPFYDEKVIRAVAECETPIISAVGHQQDCPFCDLAADCRVATPTAAAEMVTRHPKAEILSYVDLCVEKLENSIRARIEHARLLIKTFSKTDGNFFIENAKGNLVRSLDFATESLINSMHEKISMSRIRWDFATQKIQLADPNHILKRGFAIVRKNGSVVKSSGDVSTADLLQIRVADGDFTAVVQ
ncbi:MAG: exodeoxyribonuclease VII large subunit [Spirochaetaceae bacterium]|nr:exodeoxyribonuclease VII large subunit [Spirochaetaceae bacterium]